MRIVSPESVGLSSEGLRRVDQHLMARYIEPGKIAGALILVDLASLALPSTFSETRYEGVGFGLGVHVVIDPARAQVAAARGEYGWGGMASTAFWVSPTDELVVVFLTQLVPSSLFDFRTELKAIVYGAVLD